MINRILSCIHSAATITAIFVGSASAAPVTTAALAGRTPSGISLTQDVHWAWHHHHRVWVSDHHRYYHRHHL